MAQAKIFEKAQAVPKPKKISEWAKQQWSRKFAWAFYCSLLAFVALERGHLDGTVWAYFMGGLTLFLFMANVLEKAVMWFFDKKAGILGQVSSAASGEGVAPTNEPATKAPNIKDLP